MTNDTEHRTVRLQAMVTPAEAEFIRKTAADNGMGVSDFIREILTGMMD